MSLGTAIVHEASHMASVNPAYLIGGMGGAAIMALNLKKVTHHWHETINEGEVGVPLRKGMPRLEKGFSIEDVRRAEEEDPFSFERHYKVKDEGWYPVGPRRTLQRVVVADQPSRIDIELETSDKPRQKLIVPANITWHVSREGDNPVRSITRVKHIKTDKKDHEALSPDLRETGRFHPLEGRVQAICMTGLGRVLSGREASYLHSLTYLGDNAERQEFYRRIRDEIQQATIAQSALNLIYYGVILKKVELLPVVRASEEVQAQALMTLSPRAGAIAAVTGRGNLPEANGAADNIGYLPGAEVPEPRAAFS